LEKSLKELSTVVHANPRLRIDSMTRTELRLLWQLYDIPYLFLTKFLPENIIRRKILENFVQLMREDEVCVLLHLVISQVAFYLIL
jgi:hypothetical protein